MIVYSVTVNVDESIHEECLEWMTTKHIQEVLDTGCFKEGKVYRILSPEPDEGISYTIQYVCNNLEDYERYQIEYAALLQSEHKEKFGSKFTAYRTVMEKI
ncbi:MAG: DUF4286 family protein [Ignavibacteria bacterium]